MRPLICHGCHRWWDGSGDECECTCAPGDDRCEEWEEVEVAVPPSPHTCQRTACPGHPFFGRTVFHDAAARGFSDGSRRKGTVLSGGSSTLGTTDD